MDLYEYKCTLYAIVDTRFAQSLNNYICHDLGRLAYPFAVEKLILVQNWLLDDNVLYFCQNGIG
jgi:hypothetical protein